MHQATAITDTLGLTAPLFGARDTTCVQLSRDLRTQQMRCSRQLCAHPHSPAVLAVTILVAIAACCGIVAGDAAQDGAAVDVAADGQLAPAAPQSDAIRVVAPVPGQILAQALVELIVEISDAALNAPGSLAIGVQIDEDPTWYGLEWSQVTPNRWSGKLETPKHGRIAVRLDVDDDTIGKAEVRFTSIPLTWGDTYWWTPYTENAALVASIPHTVAPPLYLSPLPNFLGPAPLPDGAPVPAKSLVVTFLGRKNLHLANATLSKFPAGEFDFMLCMYEKGVDLEPYAWAADAIIITRPAQMKWWYVKRFVTPDLVSAYSHVWIVDEDAAVQTLDPLQFQATMRQHHVRMAQPAHTTSSNVVPAVKWQAGMVLSWTNFVECGPMTVFDTAIWQCVWSVLQSDLVSGYGYDLVWSSACAPSSTAVLHTAIVNNQDSKSASSRPNFWVSAVAEALVLFERMSQHQVRPQDPTVLSNLAQE